jgi:outer membrane biosynthesis protein TonB
MNLRPALLLLMIVVFTAAVFGQSKDELISAVPTELATAAYPFVAIESGVSGDVSVEVDINTKGKVTAARVLSGPGFTCPDVKNVAVVSIRNAATEAAMKTKYKPAKLNGKAVASTGRLAFGFTPPSKPATNISEPSREFSAVKTVSDSDPLNGSAIILTSPTFPKEARKMKIFGTVIVNVLIETDGTVFSAEAVEGPPLLRAVSQTAACTSLFKPTLLSGQPVKVEGVIRYHFAQ